MSTPPIDPQNTPETNAELPPFRVRTRPAKPVPDDRAAVEKAEPKRKTKEGDYAVGYRKPPVATRFKPGRSGNPKGRPKAAKGLKTIVRDTMTQKVVVRTASGEKRITRIEAALHKNIELAMKGNTQALAQLLKLYTEAVPDSKSHTDQQSPPEDMTATDLAILEELRQLLLADEEGSDETES